MKTTKSTLHSRCITALNRAGLTDMYGQFYGQANAYNVTSFILRKARSDMKQRKVK